MGQGKDLYQELSTALDEYVTVLRAFIIAKSERLAMISDVRQKLVRIEHLGKMIGGVIAEKVQELIKENYAFLEDPEKAEEEDILIKKCVELKNNLWEL